MATGQYHRDLAKKKRSQIVVAARRLFIDRGFDAMTMSDVAERANVSAMTLYKHFPSKDDLLNAILDELRGETAQVLNAQVDESLPPREALYSYCLQFCALIRTHDFIETWRHFVAISPKFPEQGRQFRIATRDLAYEALADYLGRLIELGQVRPHRTSDSVGQIIGYLLNSLMFSQLIERHEPDNPGDPELLSEIAVDTFFRAYGC